LLESVYEIVLAYELQQRGLHVNRQVPIPIRYKDMIFNEAFRGDLVIEEKVILELKSVEQRVRLIRTGSNITTVNRMQTGFLAQLR
jgi:GxxExxY protein